MKKRVCDIIMETVVARGITDCFAVVGGGAMYLDNALYKNKGLHKVFNHHEQACAMAAEAYARYADKMALVCVTSGPGGTNTLTGVMGAWVDSIPMLVISGQVRYAISVPHSGLKLRYRGTQEFNIVDTVKTMTKYAKMVTNPLDIRMEINKAIDIAVSGRRGPVWLDIPMDIQSAVVDEEELTPDVVGEETHVVAPSVIADLVNEINNAERPVVLIGRGVSAGGARETLRQALRLLKIPLLSSSSTADALYHGIDNYFGSTGSFGPRTGNFIIQNADLILSIGCSLGFSSTGFAQEYFAPNAKIIAVDVEPDEMKKPGINVSQFIHSDATVFLNSFLDQNRELIPPVEWLAYCNKVKTRFTPFEAACDKKPDDRVCFYVFWSKYYHYAKEDTITVLGNNTAIIGALQAGVQTKGQRIIGNKNCGSMGYDLPAAIGAAVASKKEVILVTGDGSFMMNLQELQTIIHYGLNVKIVIFENRGYNAIRQTSKNFFNGELIGCTPETGVSFPSFEKIASAFGFGYQKCKKNADVDKALYSLFDAKEPVILEISELLDDPVVPKVMSRTLSDGTLATPALQDMAPFIDKEEYDALMCISKEYGDGHD